MVGPLQAAVGDELPTFVRSSDLALWNRFAAVNDEYVPLHMDDEAGRAAGYPGAIGMGRLQWSYLHALLRDWLGGGGRIVSMSVQYRAPQLRGGTVAACGRVTAIRDEGSVRVLDLDVWIEDASGTVLAPGSATLEVAGAEA